MAIHRGDLRDSAAALNQMVIAQLRIITGLESFTDDDYNPVLSSGFRLYDTNLNGAVTLDDNLGLQRYAVGLSTPTAAQLAHIVEGIKLKHLSALDFTPNDRGGKDIDMQDIVNEFGGTGAHGLSEYYRGGGFVPQAPENSNIPESGPISIADFYGGTNVFTYNITENVASLNLIDSATAAGWDGRAILRVNVTAGTYVYGDAAGDPGMVIDNHPGPGRIEIFNSGYIMGKGGKGGNNGQVGGAGAPGIEVKTAVGSPVVKITNYTAGYIAGGGGGGGGGQQAGGGGGAGGGNGGTGAEGASTAGTGGAPGSNGGNAPDLGGNTQGKGGSAGGSGGGVQENKGSDTVSAGGGGGRVLPGTGVNALVPSGNKDDWAGGFGGGPEQAGGRYSRVNYEDPTRDYGNVAAHGGGGGGGWGAAGGNGKWTGGAAGRGIKWGDVEPEITNNGTIYGAYT